VEELGYKVDESEDIRKRKDEWEQGKPNSQIQVQKKPVEDLGYKVDEAEDIRKRKDEWEKGKPVISVKKPVEELGYKVEVAEDVRNRREEWEKGKPPVGPAPKADPDSTGYKVETEGVKERLNKWQSVKESPMGVRKDPVAIPITEITKDDQTDVRSSYTDT